MVSLEFVLESQGLNREMEKNLHAHIWKVG